MTVGKKSNIVKGIYFGIILFFFSTKAQSQELIEMNLNLNPGGKIYDVAIDHFNQVYLIVGDFTHVGNQQRKNFAAINMDDFTLNTDSRYEFIDSVSGSNGVIWSIETYTEPVPFGAPGINRFVYLGGNFDTLDAKDSVYYRPGFAAFLSYQSLSGPPFTPGDYFMNNWEPNFYLGSGFNPGLDEGIHDMLIDQDSLFLVGDFTVDHTTFPFGSSINITQIDLTTQTSLPFANGGGYGNGAPLHFIHRQNGETYFGGENEFIVKTNSSGDQIPFNLDFTATTGDVIPSIYWISQFQDSLLLIKVDHHNDNNKGDDVFIMDETTGQVIANHPLMNFATNSLSLGTASVYKDWFYGFDNSNLDRGFLGFINDGATFTYPEPFDWSAQTNTVSIASATHVDQPKCQWILGNKLITSTSDLSSADGQQRIGWMIHCLEPADAEPFIVFDTTICQGDTLTYTVGSVQYASGYEWSYSGTGVDLDILPGPDTNYFESENPSIDIRFLNNFTPGTLTVTPYSDCDSNTVNYNRIYSTSVSINISTNPLPNANAGLDTVLNCYHDTISLFGYSDTANVTYSWNKLNTPFIADSLGQNLIVTDSNLYLFQVENAIGCKGFDTVIVTMDKLLPTFDTIISGILGCGDTIFLLGHCNNLTDTLSWWQKTGSPDTLQNPAPATIEGNYDFYTQNLINGCVAQVIPSVYVGENIDPPNIEMTGFPSIPALTDLFVLDCNFPEVELKLYSDTANTTLNFVDSNYDNPYGDSIVVNTDGIYYVHAINNDNNCETTTLFTIGIDTLAPNIIFDPITALNCSNDSLILNGSTNFNDTTLVWTNALISPSPNPLNIQNPGYYTLTITNNANGCESTDSLHVIQNNSIDVYTSNDTVVCDLTDAVVSASYGGTINNISYLWSNGATNSSTIYTGGTDDRAIIEIFGDGGCYGTDTILIDTPPFPVVNFTSFQPCGSSNSGYIVANPISGWAPFDYSIDNGITYQSNSTLNNLSVGNYSVFVRDSLNCDYSFPVEISANSNVASPEFLFSTYNYQSDTVAVVDVSSPPTDSVNWFFSNEIVLLDENNGSPIIILPDTGSFFVTMDGYYGTCLSSVTKQIYVSELDTTAANPYNDNGIKSLNLYPNPTSGYFTVELEFFTSQACSIAIQDMPGNVLDQIDYPQSLTITENFNMDLSLNNGTYILRVFSEFDSAYITFILNR